MPVFSRPDDGDGVSFFFDDEAVEARGADTIATALIDSGRPMTSRSAKYRRPRGPYCLNGDCGTCLVRVDGEPNVRACTTLVRAGMAVNAQNTFRPKTLDPTQLADTVFAGGFDHHHFMVKPRLVNVLMQTVARELTGFGDLPDQVDERPSVHRHHEPTVLIVGGGPAGRACAQALADAGVDHLLVERRADWGLPAPLPGHALVDTAVFGAYSGEQLWAAAGHDGATRLLHTFRAAHVVLAVGARDPMLPFANNDVPGVVSARALVRTLARLRARLNRPCVVVGRGEIAGRCAEQLGTERVDVEDLECVLGGRRVEGVRLRGGRTIACRLVAVAAPPAPAHELAAQAGARLRWDGSGYAVVREESGRCGRFGRAQLWAVGDLTGYKGDEAAAADGARVGRQVATTVQRLGAGA